MENEKLVIPEQWTFKSENVANNFDAHVVEQLPWYRLTTEAVVHIGKHYIPNGGLIYDVGASTGNISFALHDIAAQRKARIIAVEESPAMVKIMKERQRNFCIDMETADALKYDFQMYDFAVCFLTMMFMPVAERVEWLHKMITLIKPGGAFVVVDKLNTPSGYVGTVLRRLAMSWKVSTGTSAQDIINKELSLAGYQRPLSEHVFDGRWTKFFQLGEFAGWICERSE